MAMATAEIPVVGGWGLSAFLPLRRDPLRFFTQIRELGDVVEIRVPGRRFLLVSHPRDIEQILVAEARKFIKGRGLQITSPVLGNGLLTSNGAFWLRQRRLIQPIFHRQRIEARYAPTMVELAERILLPWHDGEIRDVADDMARLALGIAARTLFSVDVDAGAETVRQDLTTVMRYLNRTVRGLVPSPAWIPTPGRRRFIAALERLDAVIYGMIEDRAQGRQAGDDLLGLLMTAHGQTQDAAMSRQQVRDEAMTLFLAGHETTANGLAWTWFLLAQNPDVVRNLEAEWDRVLHGRQPEPSDVGALPYTEAVVNEALRLYPPAWIIARQAQEPFTLAGKTFPQGTQLVISQWVTQRDPRFFADPERFLPERWLNDGEPAWPSLAYFPFGAGPRLCIGRPFGILEMILVLATIGQRFRLHLDPAHSVVPEPLITLRPRYGIRMVLEQRQAFGPP